MALLDEQRSRVEINRNIKELQKTVNKIKLTATFAKGNTKSELNQIIKQIESQLRHVKLQAKIDNRQLNREINNALRNVSAQDIHLNFNSTGERLNVQVRRAVSQAREFVSRNPLSLNIDLKKEKLLNQLTAFTNKHTKINESSYWLGEAERLRTVISSVTNRDELRNATDQLQVFTSGVRATGYAAVSTTDRIKGMLGNIVKVGNYFGLAFIAINKFRQSLNNLKEMDTIFTEISKTTDMTSQKLQELADRSYSIASKYGVLAKNFSESLQEMSRAGFGDGAAEPLAELATLAQSAGALTSGLANDYLIASSAAYGYQGNVEKLNALLDSQNQVTNRNAVSMTELADATKVAANQLSNASITEQEMTALLGTGIATTKESGQVVGRAVKAIVMNLQQVKNTDEGLETTAEDLGKVESCLDSLGIKMKETADGITRLRNPIAILSELSKVYNSLPEDSAERANIISDIGGKYRGNVLSSILSNWETYIKMMGDYENAAGSALREAEKSADSWEGRVAQLQNNWDSLIASITSKNAIKGGISFLDNTIQAFEKLTDAIGAIPVLLTTVNAGMSALNKNYGINQLINQETKRIDIRGNIMGLDISAYRDQVKHFREASEAMQQWNDKLTNGTADINTFGGAVVQNNEQLRAYLRTTSVEAPASLSGYRSFLNSAGVSTDALRLKTVLLTSAVSLGFSLAIQAAVTGISKLLRMQEEARESAEEAANTYKETASSIDDCVKQYKELHDALLAAKGNEEETYNVKKQLFSLQKKINDTYSEEYGAINLVTEAYKNKTDAIKAYNKEAAQTFLNENEKGIRDAVSQMTKQQHYTLSDTGIVSSSDEGRILKEIAEKYADQGVRILDEMGDGSTFSIHLEADAQAAYDTINAFEGDIRDKAKKLGDEHMFDDILEISSGELSSAKEVIDKYGDIFRQALTAQIASDDNKAGVYDNALKAVEEYNEAVLRSEDPYHDEDVESARKNLETVKEGIYSNEEEWGRYRSVMDDVFAQADTKLIDFNEKLKNSTELKRLAEDLSGMDALDVQSLNPGENASFDKLKQSAEQYGLEVDDLIEALIRLEYIQGEIQSEDMDRTPVEFNPESFSETIEAISSLQSVYNDFYNDVKESNNFTFDFSDIESLREAFGDTCAEFENFEKLATSSATSAEELQQSFDTLATQYVIASLDGLNESTREQIISQLELQGIIGSSELLTEELAGAYGILSDNGYTLADATNTAYWELLNEADASETAKGSLYALAAAEIAYNNTGLDVQGKISQLGQLAQAYGDTATAAIAQAAADRVANGHGDYESVYADMMAGVNRAAQISTLKLGQSSSNASKGKAGGSKSKKEKEEEFDWIEKKIENLEEEISSLDKTADSAYSSIAEKNEALAGSIEKINEEIGLQQQAYERYMQKAESVGLSDEYKNLVREGAVDIESITDEDLKEAIKNYEQWYDKAKETQDKINDLYDDAKDKHVAAYELEAGELEKLRDNQAITEREYLDGMLSLYEKYYAAQADFANQAKEAKLKYLKEEKEYLEDVANAAASLLDDQIDAIEDDKDRAHKDYDDQIAGSEDIIKGREKEKDAIQLKIDALKDEGDELDRQKNLLDAIKSKEEALAALERAKEQRSQLLYKDGQMVWTVDDSKLKEANKNVEDAQDAVDKAERDIQIADLQAQIDLIQDGIDALDDEKARIEALADESDAFFDKKIADMKEYQNEWKKALEIQERAIALTNLESMFGDDAVEQVLAHNTTLLSTWKQNYVDTMAAIDLASGESVGQITSRWGELAGVSVDMDNALRLSGQSMEGLSGKVEMLGTAVSETADASERVSTALGMTDMSNAGEQFRNVGLSAQDAQTQINDFTEKLNTLTSDVQNYTIPAINSEQFTASLGTGEGTGGILGDLNTFIERFREICASIPSIWTGMMSSMSGQGGVTNGESVGYGYLFKPLINAMDAAKLEIDAKLQEYKNAWTQFNTDLGDIIGVGTGGNESGAQSGKSGSGVLKSPLSARKNEKQTGADTIVGTIESGGEASVDALNNTWIPGFEGFASSIDSMCASICSMVEDMTNDVIDMANEALKAMKEVEAKNTGAYKLEKAGSGYSSHAVSPAHADGISAFADGKGAVVKDQTSLVNELGNEGLVRDGVLHEIQGGAQEIRLKKGDIIFNHEQMEELKKHDRVTSNGGHGKLIGSFASGSTAGSRAVILDNQIRDMWNSEEFKKLLENIEKLRNGQTIIIDQNNTILKDKSGNPYCEGTIITPKGDVYTPLPDDHPVIQMQKSFEAYVKKMGGIDFLGVNAMAQHERQMESMVKQITNSSVVTNNNNMQPVINVGGINITCPGVTDQHVMKQIGIGIQREFEGLLPLAYQEIHKSR